MIVVGDFNCALTNRDKKGGNPISRKALVTKEIEQLANLLDLTDIWRDRNPVEERFIWRKKSSKIQCRLDYFLISKALINEALTCEILNAPETDHSIIKLHLKSESSRQPKGPGFWKFNNSLLEDEKYTNKLRESITLFKNKYSDVDDLSLRWDLLKMEIHGFTVKYSKIKAKMRKSEELILQNKVNELIQKSERNPGDKLLLNELYATKSRLQTIMRQKTKGAIIRSKALWHEQGERNTRYFYNLEKRNQNRKTVSKLKVGSNKYTSDQFQILEEEKRFYETLYRSKSTDVSPESTFFKPDNISLLKEEEQQQCEGLVSENECLNAFKELKMPNLLVPMVSQQSFINFFWPELGNEMVSSFNHAFQTGILSISQRRGIISLIPPTFLFLLWLSRLRPLTSTAWPSTTNAIRFSKRFTRFASIFLCCKKHILLTYRKVRRGKTNGVARLFGLRALTDLPMWLCSFIRIALSLCRIIRPI